MGLDILERIPSEAVVSLVMSGAELENFKNSALRDFNSARRDSPLEMADIKALIFAPNSTGGISLL